VGASSYAEGDLRRHDIYDQVGYVGPQSYTSNPCKLANKTAQGPHVPPRAEQNLGGVRVRGTLLEGKRSRNHSSGTVRYRLKCERKELFNVTGEGGPACKGKSF